MHNQMHSYMKMCFWKHERGDMRGGPSDPSGAPSGVCVCECVCGFECGVVVSGRVRESVCVSGRASEWVDV